MTDVNTAVTLAITGEVPATALQRARDYAQQAKSQETKRVYKVHWAQFETWCRGNRLRSLPAKPATAAAYAAFLAQDHKPGSIQAALSAISQAHKLAGSCLSGCLSKPLPLAYSVIPLRSGLRGRVRLWAKASPWPPSEPCSASETGVRRRPTCSCGAMDLQTIAP